MRLFIIAFVLFFASLVYAQSPKPSIAPSPAPSEVATFVIAPDPAVVAPPTWLVQALDVAYKFPMVGPLAAKAAQWLGVILSILTILAGAAIGVIRALSTVLSAASLAPIAQKIASMEGSKVVYWLKFFSAFNAPKPVVVPVDQPKQ